MDEQLIKIQNLCLEIRDTIEEVKAECVKYHGIKNEDAMKEARYYSEKLNETRSYLVYLSKEIEKRKVYLENEVSFYMWREERV